ncbi:fibrinogen-like protein 1 [Bactrocera dorsalis]|uniref:Fibrinogen-like protein 1 n=1 Tax=Bactrocera dorsalis TaxID=27457 RepID=A0A6I9V839_BACDO|nr:fibrinogen-like protein 1 [Bactrocera dorsalis]
MHRQCAILIAFALLTLCQFENATGSTKQYLPTSCAEAVHFSGRKPSSGIYQLRAQLPDQGDILFYVYCLLNPNGGEAWTVIQRRQDGNIHFNRNWREYKNGFGNLSRNFFIGLDKLHALTATKLNELWIQLKDFENVEKNATYESFALGSEEEKYALIVLGAYSGSAGDSLTGMHDGRKFSTYDQDNSERGVNCAEIYKGGWWFSMDKCLNSHLNGYYKNSSAAVASKGLIWSSWHGRDSSLKYVHMAIRPKYNSFV